MVGWWVHVLIGGEGRHCCRRLSHIVIIGSGNNALCPYTLTEERRSWSLLSQEILSFWAGMSDVYMLAVGANSLLHFDVFFSWGSPHESLWSSCHLLMSWYVSFWFLKANGDEISCASYLSEIRSWGRKVEKAEKGRGSLESWLAQQGTLAWVQPSELFQVGPKWLSLHIPTITSTCGFHGKSPTLLCRRSWQP